MKEVTFGGVIGDGADGDLLRLFGEVANGERVELWNMSGETTVVVRPCHLVGGAVVHDGAARVTVAESLEAGMGLFRLEVSRQLGLDQPRIVLMVRDGEWVGEWFGPKRAAVEQVFGSAIVPTGFTADAQAEVVRLAVEARNPGYVVVV